MSDVITVENLGKRYLLDHRGRQEPYLALRDVVADAVKQFGRRLLSRDEAGAGGREEFWALKEVSFTVRQGERLGIIGRNGAGKSTLLKILSRITGPTTGSVRIKGKVASLLEVGTGFHPELTGRENIFLNGAILGMSRAEISRRFDEIVDFAEIERFLDTPVKRYSSGMYVRLAFAVAAHLEPEILVVDEVLAVGDAQFQRKCLGKMEDVSAREGRTVLFVSHNISAINSLCTHGLLLKNGSVHLEGSADLVSSRFLTELASEQSEVNGRFDLSNRNVKEGTPAISAITVYDHNGTPCNTVVSGKRATIEFEVDGTGAFEHLDLGLGFYTPEGFRITSATTWSHGAQGSSRTGGGFVASFTLDEVPFTAGKIMMSPSVCNSRLGIVYDHPEMSCSLNVVEDDFLLDKRRISRPFGVVSIDGRWQL